MIHSYSFSNYQSFRELTHVDFVVDQKTPRTDWIAELPSKLAVSKLMCVIGPNASGKTSLLKPLAFILWFVSSSFHSAKLDGPILFTPHFAAPENEVSRFECVFDFDGEIWRYELYCTREKVIREALYKKVVRFNRVLVRGWVESKQGYEVTLPTKFGFTKAQAEAVPKNISLIAAAAQNGAPLAVKIRSYLINHTRNINMVGLVNHDVDNLYAAAKYFSKNEQLFERLKNLLIKWDFGLSNVHIEEMNIPSPNEPDEADVTYVPYGVHQSKGRLFQVPFALESTGTQMAFTLMHEVLPVLDSGGIAIIDEFERGLHPHMLEPVLELFADSETNPKNAQLIFTCQAPEVLRLLGKSQIQLVQKNAENESEAWRLDEVVGIRSDDNLYAKYMAGAYGAVPNV